MVWVENVKRLETTCKTYEGAENNIKIDLTEIPRKGCGLD